MDRDRFDFIVVGAGSAGCALAARLSEVEDATVLCLEAGSSEVPPAVRADIDDPAHWKLVQNTAADWRYRSVPQPELRDPQSGGPRVTEEPRGKLPGGSSNFYIMMHVRGHRSDFDNWAYAGCPGWSYDAVLPYFQKLEDYEDDTNPLGGHGGPLSVADARRHEPSPASRAFEEACIELGFPRTEDFNGPRMDGVGWHHANIRDGRRHNMFAAYLDPALARPNLDNLTLTCQAQVSRLLFDGDRCVGVEYTDPSAAGQVRRVAATREVIVCAGAIESPKLLLLSGIGDPAQLGGFDIPVVAPLPGVGENFHNHVLAPVIYQTRKPLPAPHFNLSEVALFYRSDPGWVGPDMQMAFVHRDPAAADGDSGVVIFLPGVVRPMSRGSVRLDGPDHLAPPRVDPAYLSAASDLERLAQGMRLADRIATTRALSPWIGGRVLPSKDVVSDDQFRDAARLFGDSYHHQAGSCRMGSDAMAVVDPQLRVYGVRGLRVADASVMPQVPSGNCHTAIVMIAERAADLIKAEHGLKTTRPLPAGTAVPGLTGVTA